MASLDAQGMLIDPRIVQQRSMAIEHGDLDGVHAIVLHQTDSSSAEGALNSYRTGPNGAHFLIDTDGTIYQTASLNKRCYHIGTLIRSRCLALSKDQCSDPLVAKARTLGWTAQIKELNRIERMKSYPARYPVNSDSVGIEIVGRHLDDKTYEAITAAQQGALTWLIEVLHTQFSNVGTDDVFRHPDVSYKNPGEAASATWK